MNRFEDVHLLRTGPSTRISTAIDPKNDGRKVALKEIMPHQGSRDPRIEFEIIRSASHPNVVQLLDIIPLDDEMDNNGNPLQEESGPMAYGGYLSGGGAGPGIEPVAGVFEYLRNNLTWAVQRQREGNLLSQTELRQIMFQFFQGLDHIHGMDVTHRDIKPSNVLVDWEEGKGLQVKIADFGLAQRKENGVNEIKLHQGTRWYKPPEVLLGDRTLKEVHHPDMWAAGCLFAELLTGSPIFNGTCELHQLGLVTSILPVTDTTLEYFKELPYAMMVQLECSQPGKLIDIMRKSYLQNREAHGDHKEEDRGEHITPEAVDLVEKLLNLNPTARPTAREVLSHRFFEGVSSNDRMQCEAPPVLCKEEQDASPEDKAEVGSPMGSPVPLIFADADDGNEEEGMGGCGEAPFTIRQLEFDED